MVSSVGYCRIIFLCGIKKKKNTFRTDLFPPQTSCFCCSCREPVVTLRWFLYVCTNASSRAMRRRLRTTAADVLGDRPGACPLKPPLRGKKPNKHRVSVHVAPLILYSRVLRWPTKTYPSRARGESRFPECPVSRRSGTSTPLGALLTLRRS